VEQKMPNVVGMDVDVAKNVLTQLGFENVKTEVVESQKPKNEVIYQSVTAETETDVSSEITLLLSEGPVETTMPETTVPENTVSEETESTEPQEELITVRLGIEVPVREEDYALDVCLKGTTDALTTKLVAAGSGNTTLELSGIGVVEYDLYIDGEYESTLKVTFKNP